jgi:hypothetical protein
MNGLSWFLYFADILPNLGAFAIFIAFVFGIISVVYTITKAVANAGDNDAKAFVEVPIIKYSIGIFVVAAFLAIAMPSKETIYLIAGSEAGEYVVKTPEAQEILTDIKEVIKLQLEGMKNEKTK